MANSSSVVELILRARNESAQTVQELTSTLNVLNDAQQKISASSDDARTKIAALKDQYQQLSAASKALLGQNSLIEQFRKQKTAVLEARREYAAAQRNVSELAATLKAAGADTSADSGLQRAAAAAARANVNYERQRGILTSLRQSLDSAGISTNKFNATQAQLASNAERVRAQMDRVEKELLQVKSAADQASRGVSSFGRSGSASIPGISRLKVEVGALLAAYVGLRGIGRVTTSVFNVNRELEAAESRFRVGLGGDNNKVAEEMKFVRQEADRLKLSFPTLVKEYSKFVGASKGTGLEVQELRTIFTGLAEAARVNRLSADDLGGAFRAVTQILSKGKVQAEELRGQLGDRFPGAVQIMAAALNVSNKELEKMLENGQLTSDSLVNFGFQLSKQFGEEVPNAVDSADGALAEFENVVFDLNREIAASGFLEVLIDSLKELTEEMKSEEFKSGARTLGKVLGGLAKAIVLVVKNIDVLLPLIGSLVAIKTLGANVSLLRTSFSGLSAVLGKGVIPKLLALGKIIFSLVGAFAGGFAIGTALRKEFAPVRAFGVALVAGFKKLFIEINLIVQQAAAFFKIGWIDAIQEIKNALLEFQARVSSGIAVVADSLGLDDFADGSRRFAEALRDGKKDVSEFSDELKRLREEADKAKRDVDDIASQLFQDAFAAPDAGSAAAAESESNPFVPADFVPDTGSKDEAQAKKLQEELARINRAIAEAEADTIEKRLALIRDKYKQLIDDLNKAGNEIGVGQVEKLITIEEIEETRRFNQEKLNKAESDVNELLSLRQQLLENINLELENGAIKQGEAFERTRDVNDKIVPQLQEMIDKAKILAEQFGDKGLAGKLKQIELELEKTNKRLIITAEQINQSFAGGFVDAIDRAVTGVQSLKESFKQFASEFLREIARMILQQIVLNALQNSGFGGSFAGAVNAGVSHAGGMAGQSGVGRRVSASLFRNAPRYHNGGLAGIASDEVPAILQTGEEVLSRRDPRNVANGGGASKPEVNLQIVNAIDSGSVVAQGINSREGGQSIFNYIKTNRSSINNILGT